MAHDEKTEQLKAKLATINPLMDDRLAQVKQRELELRLLERIADNLDALNYNLNSHLEVISMNTMTP